MKLNGVEYLEHKHFSSRTKLNQWLKTAVGTIHIARTTYGVWIVWKPAWKQQFQGTIDELNAGLLRCKKCNQLVTARFPVCLCGYGAASL